MSASLGRDKYNVLFWVLIGCTIITVIVTVFMMYRMSEKPSIPKPSTIPTAVPEPEAFIDTFTEASDIVYIYSENCGWCDRFNPVWQDFSERYKGSLRIVKVESKQPEARKYKVTGYPTVMVVKGGDETSLFKGDRTVENLMKFAQENESSI